MTEDNKINGETSDGYHTFNELYEHRHALFSALAFFTKSWKSKLHSDGTMFDGWFIAGIETPKGQATYHLPMRLFDSLQAAEIDKAPEFDGHTANDTIDRIRSIPPSVKQCAKCYYVYAHSNECPSCSSSDLI